MLISNNNVMPLEMKNEKGIRKVFNVLMILFISFSAYLDFEPSIANSAADSITVTQSVTSELSLSAPADVTMSPSIAGMSGGTGDGSATWNVKTDDTAGFNLRIKASTNPALQTGASSFADYTETTAGTPDFSWNIAAADSEFGYTVEPATVADTAQAFKDNGTTCGGSGTVNAADKCWDGLSTTDTQIVNRTSITNASGENEVVKFKAQSGTSHFQAEGNYVATITVTATTN